MLELDTKYLNVEIDENMKNKVKKYHEFLHNDKNFPLGFITWPENYDKDELQKIEECAEKIRNNSDVFVIIGIGGSYLGAKAAIDFLKGEFYNDLTSTLKIYFVGTSMSASSIADILEICKEKDVSLNVISKSGSTIEPAVTFKIFRDFMNKKYGEHEASKRIFCTTDKEKGELKSIANKNGYKTFIIPDDIGGRFSVLTSVGLLPMAVCKINIKEVLKGAKKAKESFMSCDAEKNICYKYAAIRNILYKKKSKQIELLSLFEPRFLFFGKWLEQLFAESEGKDLKGLFPSSLVFSSDLHSMGQLIQEGTRNLFETIIFIKNKERDLTIDSSQKDSNTEFLNGKKISTINRKIFEAVAKAHFDGNVPTVILKLSETSESSFGFLIYFFEKACAMSGLILGVNAFNQPGVEKYKNNMFELLQDRSLL